MTQDIPGSRPGQALSFALRAAPLARRVQIRSSEIGRTTEGVSQQKTCHRWPLEYHSDKEP